MGVRGLRNWICWAAPKSQTACPDWHALAGKRVGVDILGFLYRVKAMRASPIQWVLEFVEACRACSIEPVIVFDGKSPPEKHHTLQKRAFARRQASAEKIPLQNELAIAPMSDADRTALLARIARLDESTTVFTYEERDLVKQCLYASGVLALNAAYEADNVLAWLARTGQIEAVLSSDMDLLARGVESLYVPASPYPLPATGEWIRYRLSDMLHESALSYMQFVYMCACMGCDYTEHLPHTPYKRAYWLVRYRGYVSESPDLDREYLAAADFLRGLYDTPDRLMGTKQWAKLAAGAPSPEPDVLAGFIQGVQQAPSTLVI
jgi:hypothetical protein